MIRHAAISDEDLSAFLDGELPAARAGEVALALRGDALLAARLADFRADKQALATLYGGVAAEKLPDEWVARIRAAAAPAGVARPARRWAGRGGIVAMALAACVVLALGGVASRVLLAPAGDPILQQAEAARLDQLAVSTRLRGVALADAGARDAVLAQAVGFAVHAPDLSRLGWRMTEVDANPGAATLRYVAQDGRALTLFVRKSAGAPRFDLLRSGALRTCIWQDEVVGAVMMGQMSAGQMMRVASAAYVDLNL